MNIAIIVGRLGRDPEYKQTTTGKSICSFSVAASEKWKDKNGETQEKTEWINVECWGSLAAFCNDQLRKGDIATIQGKVKTRSWEDQKGEKKYKTIIEAAQVIPGSYRDNDNNEVDF